MEMKPYNRGTYNCGTCGKPGHNARTCEGSPGLLRTLLEKVANFTGVA